RQVIVHQREHVHAFDRAGRVVETIGRHAQHFAAGVTEQRADALAAAQRRIAHGRMQGCRPRVRRWQAAFQRPFDPVAVSGHPICKRHQTAPCRAARRGAASLARVPRECQNGLGATSTSSSRTMRRIETSADVAPKETCRMIAPASANASRQDAEAYQERILPAVSRTFALTIPQLDPRLRTVIANAYLLCRIADTIEDEQSLAGDVKQQFHDRFTRVVASTEDPASFARDLAPLLCGNTLAAERDLIEHAPEIIEITDS